MSGLHAFSLINKKKKVQNPQIFLGNPFRNFMIVQAYRLRKGKKILLP